MVSIELRITDPIGIHARPAAALVRLASQYSSTVTMHYGDKEAVLNSMMKLLALSVSFGSNVTLKAEGDDEQQALKAIVDEMRQQQLIS